MKAPRPTAAAGSNSAPVVESGRMRLALATMPDKHGEAVLVGSKRRTLLLSRVCPGEAKVTLLSSFAEHGQRQSRGEILGG
ncbi:MAG TPA: hypothetical protein V6D17_11370, partial [Candidatus Obscuribacterales bacterium]